MGCRTLRRSPALRPPSHLLIVRVHKGLLRVPVLVFLQKLPSISFCPPGSPKITIGLYQFQAFLRVCFLVEGAPDISCKTSSAGVPLLPLRCNASQAAVPVLRHHLCRSPVCAAWRPSLPAARGCWADVLGSVPPAASRSPGLAPGMFRGTAPARSRAGDRNRHTIALPQHVT